MNLIGLDSAFAHTGWCVLTDDTLSEYGVITTHPAQSDFERVAYLRAQLEKLFFDWGVFLPNGNGHTRVVVEQTDWSRGSRDTRAAWIREAQAREALAIGVTTAFNVCIATGVTPIVLGPRDWMREIGYANKEGIAAYIATMFNDRFEIKCEQSTRKGKARYARVVRDRATGKRVPDHVTDAIGMTLVAQRRLRLDSRIHKQEKTR